MTVSRLMRGLGLQGMTRSKSNRSRTTGPHHLTVSSRRRDRMLSGSPASAMSRRRPTSFTSPCHRRLCPQDRGWNISAAATTAQWRELES